jgi:hypothetical protein
MMFEYQPRASYGGPTREVACPQAPIDELKNYMIGSVKKPRISALGDMTGAWNDRKSGVLSDLPASSMGATILANEAIVMAAQPIEGTSSLS